MEESRQFTKLSRNFLTRFFESDLLSQNADFRATLSQALGLLASPGLFIPLLLLPLLMMDSDAARSWPIKLIFVSLSFLVMGALSVLEWDALMLDGRDRAILMALPIRPRTIFGAKFWALAQFMLIFSIDVNAGSILLLPPLEMVGKGNGGFLEMSRYAIAHTAGTVGASAFTFLLVVSIQATLINIFTPRWFRRISTAAQVFAILMLLATLFFFPAIMQGLPEWKHQNSPMFRLFPPVWFVGICEVLQGTADAQFRSVARTGLSALAAVGGWSVLAYAVAYGRYMRASLETPTNASRRTGGRRVAEALIRRAMPHPVQRAVFRFTLQTMRRSPRHRLILAAYVGTGLAIVLEEIVTLSFRGGGAWRQARQMALLSLPLVLSFFLLSGMRFMFNIPSELAANWIFQIAERDGQSDYLAGVRKCMGIAVVAPLVVLVAGVYSILLGPATAMAHAAYCTLLSLIMIELLLWRFNKLPFTCSYAPGTVPVVILLCGYWLAFMAYTDFMVLAETYFLRSWEATLISLVLLGVLLWALMLRRARPREGAAGLVFHEEPEPVVRTLDLSI